MDPNLFLFFNYLRHKNFHFSPQRKDNFVACFLFNDVHIGWRKFRCRVKCPQGGFTSFQPLEVWVALRIVGVQGIIALSILNFICFVHNQNTHSSIFNYKDFKSIQSKVHNEIQQIPPKSLSQMKNFAIHPVLLIDWGFLDTMIFFLRICYSANFSAGIFTQRIVFPTRTHLAVTEDAWGSIYMRCFELHHGTGIITVGHFSPPVIVDFWIADQIGRKTNNYIRRQFFNTFFFPRWCSQRDEQRESGTQKATILLPTLSLSLPSGAPVFPSMFCWPDASLRVWPVRRCAGSVPPSRGGNM